MGGHNSSTGLLNEWCQLVLAGAQIQASGLKLRGHQELLTSHYVMKIRDCIQMN